MLSIVSNPLSIVSNIYLSGRIHIITGITGIIIYLFNYFFYGDNWEGYLLGWLPWLPRHDYHDYGYGLIINTTYTGSYDLLIRPDRRIRRSRSRVFSPYLCTWPFITTFICLSTGGNLSIAGGNLSIAVVLPHPPLSGELGLNLIILTTLYLKVWAQNL